MPRCRSHEADGSERPGGPLGSDRRAPRDGALPRSDATGAARRASNGRCWQTAAAVDSVPRATARRRRLSATGPTADALAADRRRRRRDLAALARRLDDRLADEHWPREGAPIPGASDARAIGRCSGRSGDAAPADRRGASTSIVAWQADEARAVRERHRRRAGAVRAVAATRSGQRHGVGFRAPWAPSRHARRRHVRRRLSWPRR